jgi:hypothetical protein
VVLDDRFPMFLRSLNGRLRKDIIETLSPEACLWVPNAYPIVRAKWMVDSAYEPASRLLTLAAWSSGKAAFGDRMG